MFKKGILSLAVVLLGTVIVGISGYAIYKTIVYQKEPVPLAIDIDELNKISGNPLNESESNVKTDQVQVPEELNLKMTFYSQAPFADWSLPWQEACEEASVLLVANTYYDHNWTREQFRDEILKLVDWQMEQFGHYEHTDISETNIILNQYLGLETAIHENPSYQDIQNILAKGNFIIAPFAGKILANPNYNNGGPVYHVIVLKGYTKEGKIITHDVGTRRGEDYVYSWERLANALHDYYDPIEQGPRRIIEVLPPGTGS